MSWEQSEYMVSESNEPLMVCAEIAAGSLERDVSVSVQAESGTALAGMCSIIRFILASTKFGKIALKWHLQKLTCVCMCVCVCICVCVSVCVCMRV